MRMRIAVSVILSAMLATGPALSPASARDGHGHGFGRGTHMHGAGGGFAGGRHGNDAEVKAAAEENDRLLDNKIKSICRGC